MTSVDLMRQRWRMVASVAKRRQNTVVFITLRASDLFLLLDCVVARDVRVVLTQQERTNQGYS